MKNIKNLKYVLIFATLIVMTLPVHASAATVYLQSSRSTIAVGDTAIISVKIDADGAVLNSVEGTVGLTSSSTSHHAVLAVQQYSLGSSAFGLWPRTPSLSSDGNSVSFVGGVPGGFSIEGATLFKIIVTATSTGTVTITPEDMTVFANDGNGTKVPVQLKGLTITVVPAVAGVAPVNDWTSIISTDTTPPEPFIIVIGQDPSVYGGKKFAYFSAVDNQSGIDHYEVSEDGAPYVRSGSTYVMQDQSNSVRLNVVAYDKAGNTRSASYPIASIPSSQNNSVSWMSIIIVVVIVVILIVIIYMIGKKISKNRKLKKNKEDSSSNAPTNL